MAELTADQVRSLDQTRQRLLALHTSLTALRSDLSNPQQPLPPWSSLQTHANLISANLQQIAEQLSEHHQLLSSTIAFPLPQFPARSQDAILQTLLRTNLEPDVKEWIEQGQKFAKHDAANSDGALSDYDRHELWQWAPSAASAEGRKQKWGADYTLAEKQAGIESVVTGLRRELIEPTDDEADEEEGDEDESEEGSEDEEDEDAMEVDALPKPTSPSQRAPAGPPAGVVISTPQMPLESVHKFITTGKVG